MRSMTGMGKASGQVLGLPIRIEVKSVNHRFCEVHFRAHGKYMVMEIPIQNLVKKSISRGRVDIFVNEEKVATLSQAEENAFKTYFDYLTNISQTLDLKEDINLQHLLPGVHAWIQKEVDPEQSWREFEPILKEALKDLESMRLSEGNRLKENIKERFQNIDKIRSEIHATSEIIKEELEEKMKAKIAEKVDQLKDVDPQRLHTEVLFYLDRMEIAEELDRIKSHMSHVQDFLEAKEPIGRKIDFLLQEFNREFNTIASKSSNAEVAHLVVEAKSELEKIREQIQNIE